MKIMAKLKNHLLKIYQESERPNVSFDNRSMAVRQINKVLDTGLITIKLCSPGYGWDTKKGFHYNFVIRSSKHVTRHFLKKNQIDNMTILKCVGRFLQRDEVKAEINSHVNIPGKCHKCNGAGIIPHFMYYANGICFDCLGSGMDHFSKTIVKIKS